MKVKMVSNEATFNKINQFFGKIWKKEFNLDRFDRIDEYKKSKVYFIEENNKIISALNIFKTDSGKNKIGRFATIDYKRGKGIGTILINKAIEKLQKQGETNIVLFAEMKNIEYYKKIGFKEVGEIKCIGNTKAVKMELNLFVRKD